MYYRIIHVNTALGKDEEVWVVTPPTTIGRNAELEVHVEDESVSRSHCQLFLNADGALCVRDLGSKNGTYVNDFRVNHAILQSNDLLQLGSVTFRIVFSTDTDPGKPPPKAKPKTISSAVTQPIKVVPAAKAEQAKPWWKIW
jgi:pSer/pThr/pTyr-binding forkhead associated (FHA) protein